MGRAKASSKNLLLAYALVDAVTEKFQCEDSILGLKNLLNSAALINHRGPSSLHALVAAGCPGLVRISPETGMSNRTGMTEPELNRHLKKCGFLPWRERRRTTGVSTYRWRNRIWRQVGDDDELASVENRLDDCSKLFQQHGETFDKTKVLSMLQDMWGKSRTERALSLTGVVPRSRFSVHRRVYFDDHSDLRWPTGLERVSPSLGPLLMPFVTVSVDYDFSHELQSCPALVPWLQRRPSCPFPRVSVRPLRVR